jgi:iron complex transport system substrate-binding protein
MRQHLSGASAKLASQFPGRVVPLIAVCVLAACAGSTSSPPAGQTTHFPLTIQQPDGTSVTIPKQPQRIVSLSATATEMLFAIGAGAQVIAVDDQSNYPVNAPHTKLSGLTPNAEAIAAYQPDLVVAADDATGISHALTALAIPMLIEPAAKKLDDSYAQIRQLGAATGHLSEANSLAKQMRARIVAVVASIAAPIRPLKVYHELDDTYYSATSNTFIGQVYQLLGLTNIADRATGAASDYPQLSSEYIVSSNPDLIVLADTKCCHQDATTLGARAGWSGIAAVRSGQVIGVDDDVASRWGPRIVDFFIAIGAHVKQLETTAA